MKCAAKETANDVARRFGTAGSSGLNIVRLGLAYSYSTNFLAESRICGIPRRAQNSHTGRIQTARAQIARRWRAGEAGKDVNGAVIPVYGRGLLLTGSLIGTIVTLRMHLFCCN